MVKKGESQEAICLLIEENKVLRQMVLELAQVVKSVLVVYSIIDKRFTKLNDKLTLET